MLEVQSTASAPKGTRAVRPTAAPAVAIWMIYNPQRAGRRSVAARPMPGSSKLSFLDAAELMLRRHASALTADDILRLALESGELSSRGQTPETAMRARLASDIVTYGDRSRFIRVGPNKFALRAPGTVTYDGGRPSDEEYVACLRRDAVAELQLPFGLSDSVGPLMSVAGTPSALTFLKRSEAEVSDSHKHLIAYVVLEDDAGRILCYQRGAHSTASRFLTGAQCIGFGGHVTVDDANSLFGRADGGVLECSHRELSEELAGLLVPDLAVAGVINDDSSPNGLRHLAVVLRGRLPSTFTVTANKTERGINRLRLLTDTELWRQFDTFEFWSQLAIRRFYSRPTSAPKAIVRMRRRRSSPIALVGEIASGKTEVASYLVAAHGVHSVSTRQCVAQLLGVDDFGTGDRSIFQARAKELVTTSNGLDRLADSIAHQVRTKQGTVLIDGIRNIGTIDRLRRQFETLRVLFVDAAKDRAFEHYCSRAKRPPTAEALAEFRNARSHDVEREVSLLRYRADGTLFNDGSLPDLYAALEDWWTGAS